MSRKHATFWEFPDERIYHVLAEQHEELGEYPTAPVRKKEKELHVVKDFIEEFTCDNGQLLHSPNIVDNEVLYPFDILAQKNTGEIIGIELSELVDEHAVNLTTEYHKILSIGEMKRAILEGDFETINRLIRSDDVLKEVLYKLVFQVNGSREQYDYFLKCQDFYAEYSKDELVLSIERRIKEKDEKITNKIKKNGKRCDELILLLFSDESHYFDEFAYLSSYCYLKPTSIDKIYLLLSYDPREGRHPYFELIMKKA